MEAFMIFIQLLTENAQLMLEYFPGNVEDTLLPSYKEGLKRKMGSVSHRCLQKNI